MQISINNPIQQTILFGIFFCLAFIFSLKKKQDYTPLRYTQELKGFAILTIIFGHIGYFLSSNQEFLFPFSIMMGVGVNLFLFLSGYGITFSQITKGESVIQFYKRKLLKLFVPFWIVLFVLLTSAYVFLDKTYSISFWVQSALGIFTEANIGTDLNSPFWYFTLIVFYYVLFPFLFNKKRPWITAIILYLITWFIVEKDFVVLDEVIGLYQVHLLAFPLGIVSAWFVYFKSDFLKPLIQMYKKYIFALYPILISAFLTFIGYFSIHSGVGQSADIEQARSLYIMTAVLFLFLIKKRESKLFSVFGLYSYEIYLFHWPLMYHYDFLYKNMPAWIATIGYLCVFVALGFLFKKLQRLITCYN